MPQKVFVSGCYDMLHSGHVAFLTEAAEHGDLYVGIGSDATLSELKRRRPVNTEQERLYMIKALRVVKDAWVNSGSGLLDFEQDLRKLKPDIFFVNEDGHSFAKERLCRELGINYVVSKRKPHPGLPVRSTTALRSECRIPYRIDLAGGWLDQPFVSKLGAGPVLTISIEPEYEFNDRSGMATSSRKRAVELWQTDLPEGDHEKLARTLFCFENPPGTEYVSGSQDSIGIVYPGLNKLNYNGDFWPESVESVLDEDILDWLEGCIRLVQLQPRNSEYDVMEDRRIGREAVESLSCAASDCWKAILRRDAKAFGEAVTRSFEAQVSLFPRMISKDISHQLKRLPAQVLGYKLTGAGGGGYLLLVTDQEIDNSLRIKIRKN